MCEILHRIAVGLFQDADFAGHLEDSKNRLRGNSVYLRESNVRFP